MNNFGCRIGRQVPVSRRLDTEGRRQYAAAKVTRLTGDWIPVGTDINTIVRSSSPLLRSRIRQLVRDFPYFSRAINILVDFTVGTGMNFQSRVLNPNWQPGKKERKFDRAICQSIEDAVSWWMDEADAAGRLHFGEMERLANRQEVEVGEYLFVKTVLKDPKRYIPFALQAYETDWLSATPEKIADGNEFDQGKEFDPKTGRVVAYHLSVPSGYSIYNAAASYRVQRILAEHVVNGFDTHRAGQLCGVSPFVTAVLIAHDLSDYLDATIDTAKLAAKYLAMIETPDAAGFQRLRTVDGSGSDQGKKLESLENAIIEYLRPGEKVTFAQNNSVGETFQPFTRFVIRMLAIATGTSESLLSGNYADYNYTSLRGERQDLVKMFEPRQFRHVKHFTAPIINEAIEWAVMSGKLKLPGDYWRNPRAYQRGVFIPPGREPIEPLRESKANRDDIAAGLRSPQEIVAARGRDLEDVYDEIAEAKEMAEERGLTFDDTDTALANNPAALGATDDGAKSDKVVNISRALRRGIEDAMLLVMEGDK